MFLKRSWRLKRRTRHRRRNQLRSIMCRWKQMTITCHKWWTLWWLILINSSSSNSQWWIPCSTQINKHNLVKSVLLHPCQWCTNNLSNFPNNKCISNSHSLCNNHQFQWCHKFSKTKVPQHRPSRNKSYLRLRLSQITLLRLSATSKFQCPWVHQNDIKEIENSLFKMTKIFV